MPGTRGSLAQAAAGLEVAQGPAQGRLALVQGRLQGVVGRALGPPGMMDRQAWQRAGSPQGVGTCRIGVQAAGQGVVAQTPQGAWEGTRPRDPSGTC